MSGIETHADKVHGTKPAKAVRHQLEAWLELHQALAWITRRAEAAETDPAGLQPEMSLLRQIGLLAACVPGEFGGSDYGQTAATAQLTFEVLRLLGYTSLPVARLFEGHVNAAKLIAVYGSTELKNRIFHDVIAHGTVMGVWAVDGPDPVTFEAGPDSSTILRGKKAFASGLGSVGRAVITAQPQGLEGDNQLFVVDVSETWRQDRAVWRANGMKATLSGIFDFGDISLSAADYLGTPGDYEKEPYFEGGIWRYCAAHIGGAQALVDATLDILERRGQLSAPLQLSRMGAAIAKSRAAAALVKEWAVQVEGANLDDRVAIELAAAGAKLARFVTSETALETMQLCERSLGTFAHMGDSRANRLLRDLTLYVRQAGPDDKLLAGAEAAIARRGNVPLW